MKQEIKEMFIELGVWILLITFIILAGILAGP
jgi:hypothetical protein